MATTTFQDITLQSRAAMANKDNELKDLGYSLIENNGLQEMLDKQKQLQKRLGYDFSNMSIVECANYLIYNKHCLDDELGELLDALGGKLGNASWKTWKSANAELKSKKLTDLSKDEMTELKYEAIDVLHFVFNIFIAIGMDASEIQGMYISKNQENHKRQDENY